VSFTHLTTTEKNELYKLHVTDKLSMSEIGRRMNRNKSTISRELSRNTDEYRNVPHTKYSLLHQNPLHFILELAI
jgi:IS30 family transposase